MRELFFTLLPLVVELAAICAISGFLNKVIYERFGRKPYLFLMFPGVIVHELAHWLGCIITFTKVRKVKLFEPRFEGRTMVLGYVEHDRPHNAVFSLIIGAAPFFVGAAVLYLLSAVFVPAALQEFSSFRTILVVPELPTQVMGIAQEFVAYYLAVAASLRWDAWPTYFFFYLVVGISAHLAPSTADMKNAFGGFAVVIGIFLAIIGAGYVLHAFSPEEVARSIATPLAAVTTLLTYGLSGGLLALLVTIILSLISRLWRKLFSPFARRRGRR